MNRLVRIKAVPIYLVAMLAFLSVIVWLSLRLGEATRDERRDARQEQAIRDHQACLSRNEGRSDTHRSFLLVLNLIDPDHSSPLWIPGPPTIDDPDGRPSIEQLLASNLAPLPCPGTET